jgi:hypothetical protein
MVLAHPVTTPDENVNALRALFIKETSSNQGGDFDCVMKLTVEKANLLIIS